MSVVIFYFYYSIVIFVIVLDILYEMLFVWNKA